MLERARLAQDERAQRRRERESAHRGEAYRRRKRHGELLVDAPGDAAHESDRHEDAEQHERGRDDGARHVAHRLDGSLLRVVATRLDKELHALHHDDAVVHHHADREHQAEEREDVDRVAKKRHQDEGGAERDWDREARDERRAPVLQEEVAYEHHEAEGDAERHHDLLDAHAHIVRGVVGRDPFQVVGERLREAVHLLVYLVHRGDGVRAGLLLERDGDGVSGVELAGEHVVLLADLSAGDVLEPHYAAVLVAPHYDLVELLRRHQAALGRDGVDLCAMRRNRRRADGADRRLHVLLRDGGDHLLGVEPLRRHAVRIHPYAHRELRTVHRGLADARDSQQDGLDVAVYVVRYLEPRHGTFRGTKADYAKHVFGLCADAAAELLHLRRQLRLGLRHAVLHLDHVHVAVALDLERHVEVVRARVGAGPHHVQHVVNAVHLVLNRHSDRIEDLLGVRAWIVVRHRYGRRREARILRYGQPCDGHHARKGKHDGDDHGKTWPLHERPRERLDLVYRLSYS